MTGGPQESYKFQFFQIGRVCLLLSLINFLSLAGGNVSLQKKFLYTSSKASRQDRAQCSQSRESLFQLKSTAKEEASSSLDGTHYQIALQGLMSPVEAFAC